ncbi:MAG: Gfo/Idh/MocA family oxidoreductase [Oscillospiraceae bacterium]|nr:Gfo/Idh/MocA family oxidoreductase [Oscillospiraceae bacterium]
MDKLRVGMVGIGRGTAYGYVIENNPRTEITALCDFDEQKLAENAPHFNLTDKQLFTNYDEFINSGLDLVILGTPIPYHEEQVIKALDMNINVLCEVTAANTVKGCENIYNAVKRSKAKYMLAENCNYMHFVLEWKDFINKGYLGHIHYAEGEYVHEIRDRVIDKSGNNLWRTQRAPLHYCSHSLGPILFWLDDYIVRGTASGTGVNIIENVGPGAIDMQCALFETSKGATIRLLRSSVSPRQPALCGYAVYGSKGFIETDSYTSTRARRYFEGIDEGGVDYNCLASDPNASEQLRAGGHGTCEYYLISTFIDDILYDRKPAIDVVKALDMTLPGLIAHEAAMKGGVWMDIPLFYRQ